MDRLLSLVDLEYIIERQESHGMVRLAKQLLDTMRENGRFRIALEHYKAADDGVYQMLAGFKATKDMECPNSVAGQALRYKDSETT